MRIMSLYVKTKTLLQNPQSEVSDGDATKNIDGSKSSSVYEANFSIIKQVYM